MFVCVCVVSVVTLGACSGNLTARFAVSNVPLGVVDLRGYQIVR